MKTSHTILLLAFITFTPFIGLQCAKQQTTAQRAQQLAQRLSHIATQCSHAAMKHEPNSTRYQELLVMSTTFLHAVQQLKNPPAEHEDLDNICDQISRTLTPYTGALTRGPSGSDDVPPITLPLPDIIAMIEDEQVELHLRPSSVQLSTKRIVFRSIIELFSAFGKSKVAFQDKLHKHELSAASKNKLIAQLDKTRKAETKLFKALQENDHNLAARRIQKFYREYRKERSILGRIGWYVKKELWDDRSLMVLRTMRIMGNKFIDKVIPNPKRRKWQQFAEMLVPLMIGHFFAFIISKGRNEKWSSLGTGMANDIFIRLIMVQLFMEKKNIWYFLLMGITYLLAFYNTETGSNLWHSLPNQTHHAGYQDHNGFLSKRIAYLNRISNEQNLASVAIDGISSLVLYKLIDDVVMPHIKIPKWLLATPVCQQVPATEEAQPSPESREAESEHDKSSSDANPQE